MEAREVSHFWCPPIDMVKVYQIKYKIYKLILKNNHVDVILIVIVYFSAQKQGDNDVDMLC